MNILLAALVVIAILSILVAAWYGINNAKRFVAMCQGTNPTVQCFGSVYTSGNFIRLHPVTLQFSGQNLSIHDTKSGTTTEVNLSGATVRQGGNISWMRIVLQSGDTAYWLSPFSTLYMYMMQGGIMYTQKAFLPARNALTEALTRHGAKITDNATS